MTTSHEHLERQLEKKTVQRIRKQKPKMAVSGKSVFTLRKIITSKGVQKPTKQTSVRGLHGRDR